MLELAEDLAIVPGYTRSFDQVWLNIILKTLHSGDLTPLQFVDVPTNSGSNETELTSFIPRSGAQDSEYDRLGIALYCTDSDFSAKVKPLEHSSITIRGWTIGIVTNVIYFVSLETGSTFLPYKDKYSSSFTITTWTHIIGPLKTCAQ